MTVRAVILLLALTACTAQAPGPEAAARADRRLAEATRGRVAGEPARCIDARSLRGPERLGAGVLAYRVGADQLWLNRLPSSCPNVDNPSTIVLVRHSSSGRLCEGDPFELLHSTGRFPLGGVCSFGPFVPYQKVK